MNAAIAAVENKISKPYVICLQGAFTSPIHVWGKYAPALLTIAAAPHSSAELSLGQVRPADADPNEFTGAAGGVGIVDSRAWRSTASRSGTTPPEVPRSRRRGST